VYNNFASETTLANLTYNGYIQNLNPTAAKYLFGAQQLQSDIFVENASFFKLDAVDVGYNFGQVFGNNGRLRVFAQVQNVFCITDYTGLDPEIDGGIDNNFYQRPRVFSVGFNVQF
jgi:iron complex outermembrane receptor protein